MCRDPDDDKFISCAVDEKCLYIVSADNDLLVLKDYKGIEIITVVKFFERFDERFNIISGIFYSWANIFIPNIV